jgi:uncharacterized protein YyaL (SSP411 family)
LESTERKPNRLITEPSPYLQEHAYNPVDWFPWGPEALQLAKALNKPIFLSVGYRACHWCHVHKRTIQANASGSRNVAYNGLMMTIGSSVPFRV